MTSTNVYDELNLYETDDKFYIEPVSEHDKTLVIDRITSNGEITGSEKPPVGTEKTTIYGVLGVIKLIAGQYLIVVTGRERVGSLSRHIVYKLTTYQVISFARKRTHLNENQDRIEKEYLAMIDCVLSTPNFYFSYSYDISHTVQRLHHTSPDFLSRKDKILGNVSEESNRYVSRLVLYFSNRVQLTRPMYVRGEQKFIWNEHLLSEFSRISGVSNFCLPIIHGFVSITPCSLNGKNFVLAIISRRSKERAGCRLFTRGIDASGNVANFVETEQIIEATFERASFVQVSQQEGIFRTNCIDCLDRTNVVQSMLARASLTFVLQKLSILKKGQLVEDQIGLERLFKTIWADHADQISLQYSGSGALKTDYTRTGKRTKSGILKDLMNALTRYYKNNFQHGFRKDALDLFLGNYKVSQEEGIVGISPLELTKQIKYRAFPLILLVAISMFFANLITPSEYTTGTLLSLLFWASMISATLSVIFYYGSEYIDAPRLCPILSQPSV